MSVTASLAPRPVTLDQLVALCDEMGALSRAGVPLESGLTELAGDLPGRLGSIVKEIGRRMETGESLEQVIATSEAEFPPAFRAVIAAGIKAGRLPAALEGVARSARRLSQLRSSLGAVLLYPLTVLFVAWMLFAFTVDKLTPVMVKMLAAVGVGQESWQRAAASIADSARYWGPAVPLVFGCWLAWVWIRSGQVARGMELHPLLAWTSLGALRKMQRAGRMAAVSELLALMIENQVPLDEAVALATAAVGSPELEKSGRELAERIRRGEVRGPAPAGFPPLLAWTLSTGGPQSQLAVVLHRTAQLYRDEMTRRGQWLMLVVPLATTALVGGSVTFFYATLTLGPWLMILFRLSNPDLH